jgi:hypothetical protein
LISALHSGSVLFDSSIFLGAGSPLSLCLGIDRQRDEVAVETPLVEIAEGHVAPMLRASLELNAALPHGVRISARRARLVLRFADAIAMVPPQRLLAILRGTALLAKDLELVFRAQFPCRGLLAEVVEALRRGGVSSELRGEVVDLSLPSEQRP